MRARFSVLSRASSPNRVVRDTDRRVATAEPRKRMESLAPQEGQTSLVESSVMLRSSPVSMRTGRTRPSLASVLSWSGRRVRISRLLMEYQRSPGWRASRLISPASVRVR